MKRLLTEKPHYFILTGFYVFFVIWWRALITPDFVPSADLSFHINTMETFKSYLMEGKLSFYDPNYFTGWPALQFYGLLPFVSTILLSYPLGIFTDGNSVRLATHVMIVFLGSGLVFSIYFAAVPFLKEMFGDIPEDKFQSSKRSVYILFALAVGCFSFWFLNHDFGSLSVGFESVATVGLYGQLFGWHAYLLYTGLILRLTKEYKRKYFILFTIVIALNFLSHTLTATFALITGIFVLIWFRRQVRVILLSHLIALCLISFWLFPFIAFMGDYSVFHPLIRQNFLFTVLRYPVYSLINSLEFLIKGNFVLINFFQLLVIFLIASVFIIKEIRKKKLVCGMLVFIGITLLVISDNYLALSIPVGLHFNRYAGLLLLLLAVILPVVSMAYLKIVMVNYPKYFRSFGIVLGLIYVLCLFSNTAVPNNTIYLITENNELFEGRLEEYDKVLEHLNINDSKSRVFFENLFDNDQFLYASQHYLSTFLPGRTGHESVVGVQILQSSSYRFIFETLRLLGPLAYGPKPMLPADNDYNLDPETLLRQAKSFGITHLVGGTEHFVNKLKNRLNIEPEKVGDIYIFQIQETPFKQIEPANKVLLGYYDPNGDIPFRQMQLYFYLNKFLWSNFELIEIKDLDSVPKQIETVIVNDDREELEKYLAEAKGYNIVPLSYFDASKLIFHYKPIPPTYNMKSNQFILLKKYLDNLDGFKKSMEYLAKKGKKMENYGNPSLNWSDNNQKFTLTGLVPGDVYRINYSYFPYWQTDDGRVFRGSGDRMFFIPDKENATFVYTRLNSLSTWLGLGFTVFGLLLFGAAITRMKK